jgi:hypothetical protein
MCRALKMSTTLWRQNWVGDQQSKLWLLNGGGQMSYLSWCGC